MTAPAPNPPATTDRVLELLADGTTTVKTAELTGWPRQRIVALVNGKRGWLVDPETDIVVRHGKAATPTAPYQPSPEQDPAPKAPTARPGIVVPIPDIEPHPRNVRAQLGDLNELADSIRQHGIVQPLVVEPHPTRPRGYRLLAGHRRFAAAQLAGLDKVPVVVRSGVGVDTAIELMLIENCHRADLTALEKAEAFGELRDLGKTQADIARRTGFAGPTVAYYLTLLDLDDASKERLRAGELKVGDAVDAVRRARANTRKKGGYHQDFTWEPDHLTKTHSLAKRAKKLCEAREHSMRRRIGGTACGACWETAIRIDERKVIEAEERM